MYEPVLELSPSSLCSTLPLKLGFQAPFYHPPRPRCRLCLACVPCPHRCCHRDQSPAAAPGGVPSYFRGVAPLLTLFAVLHHCCRGNSTRQGRSSRRPCSGVVAAGGRSNAACGDTACAPPEVAVVGCCCCSGVRCCCTALSAVPCWTRCLPCLRGINGAMPGGKPLKCARGGGWNEG